MRKVFTLFVLTAILLTLFPTALANAHTPQSGDMLVATCREYVSLREYASSSAPRLTKVPSGKSVYFLSTASNGYYQVVYDGQRGYIDADYLVYDGVSVRHVTGCEEWISLRVSPSTSAERIVKIPKGATVYTVSNASIQNGFIWVNYGNYAGYALASYLSLTPFDQGDRVYITNCEEYVTLRAYASTNAPELARIPLGAVATFSHEMKNGFCCVTYNGKTGFVLTPYLDLVGTSWAV